MAKGGGTNTVEKSDPWEPSQQYLTTGMEGALQGVYNQPAVTPFSPESQYALYQQGNRALQGNPLLPAAQQQAMDTLSGSYMTGGEGFNAFADSAWNAVRPQTDSMFANSGRFGSPLHAEALGRGYGRAMAPLYDAERGRQMQATGAAPGLAMADYNDMGMLGAVGAAREGKMQQYLDEPYNRLSKYMGLITPASGMGNTITQSGGSGYSPMMGAMGGAMSGAMLGSQIYPGWGTAIGAVGGGLMGLMG